MIDLASTRRPGGGFCARMVPAGATGSGLVPLTMRPKRSGTTSGPASARLLPIRFGTHGWAPSHARRSTAASARDTAAIAAAATAIHTPLLRPACPHPIPPFGGRRGARRIGGCPRNGGGAAGAGNVGSSGGIGSLARFLVQPLAARQPRQFGVPGRPPRKRDDRGEVTADLGDH